MHCWRQRLTDETVTNVAIAWKFPCGCGGKRENYASVLSVLWAVICWLAGDAAGNKGSAPVLAPWCRFKLSA